MKVDDRVELHGVGRGARRCRGADPVPRADHEPEPGTFTDGAWLNGVLVVVPCPWCGRQYVAGPRANRHDRTCLACHAALFPDHERNRRTVLARG